MTNQDVLQLIETLIYKITNKKTSISLTQDLQRDEILDSLDSLVFFMELEIETGLSVPEVGSLVDEGWYSVEKLCNEIIKLHKQK